MAHRGLVAGMFDELGMGEVIDQTTHQHPETRDLTAGEAAKAMVRNGLGCIDQALFLVPRFFHPKPTSRLISPRIRPEQLNDDPLGRALNTLYIYSVTQLYSLMIAHAAARLALAPAWPMSSAPAFMSMGATTVMKHPRHRACTSPGGTGGIIGRT